jgi:hypothetical protein
MFTNCKVKKIPMGFFILKKQGGLEKFFITFLISNLGIVFLFSLYFPHSRI